VSELPSGWVETTIGEVLQFNYGKGLPERDRSGSGFPVYGSNGVVGYHEKALVPAESLVVGRKGSVGEIHHSRGPCWPIDTTYFVDEFSGMPARFWYYVLKGLDLNRLNRAIAIPGLNREDAYQVDIVLPPQTEQKRIADKLDAILAQVNACRERLDRVPAILKCFRQAVLAAATSGTLTEEYREDQVLDDWQTASVEAVASEVFDGPFGSNLKSKDYSEAGVRVVRLENIGWLNFIADKETFIPREKYEVLRKHTLRAKDVLFSSFIAEEVRVCLLPDELSEQAINKADCFCVRTDPSVCLPEFLALRLACHSTFLALEQEVHGATRPRINLRQLKEFTFELPPLSEQREIVRCVEALFTSADRLEDRYSAARAQVERLTPALLAKAFCGELVPQDPNDEPASVLLERIRAARAEQPMAKRGRKPPATRVPRAPKEKAAMTKSRHDDDVQHKPYLAGLLREAGGIASVEDLFRRAELPVTDFYKQLAWEVENGHIRDDETRLEAA
jgi:type I restriction enzyme S subunit